ncbi:hypothetical protein AB1Y20_017478 [Prymnesium parvum]|uniref:Alkaline phosphatase n=1 Tax=Prymnesium parvum TaxID=97485 RepID=A0AB34JN92_PRYPA
MQRSMAAPLALFVLVTLALLVPMAVLTARGDRPHPPKPRNVIFMVGDGFGPSAATLARVFKNHAANNLPAERQGSIHSPPMHPLRLDAFLSGSSRTYSADSLVTDSAAGATAFSCGLKSYNGAIAWTPQGVPCGTVMEVAQRRGMKTGLVVTSSVTDATPAAFAAHVPSRRMQQSIAMQYALNRTADLVLGGGRAYFESNQLIARMQQPFAGSADAADTGQRAPYAYVTSRTDLAAARTLPLLGLFAEGDMPWEIDRDPTTTPSLGEMTEKALQLLDASSSVEGFFLMVEGSQIDKAAHPNDAATMLREVLEFDLAVGQVLDFAARDGRTLVVITADHETGGLSLGRGIVTDRQNDSEAVLETRSFAAEAAGHYHTDYAFAPETLGRVTKSSEWMVFEALSSLEWEPSPACSRFSCSLRRSPELRASVVTAVVRTLEKYATIQLRHSEVALIQEVVDDFDALGPYGIIRALASITSARAHIGWSTWGHSGVDVMVYATGPGRELFMGNSENMQIGQRVAELMGFNLEAETAKLGTPVMVPDDHALHHGLTARWE